VASPKTTSLLISFLLIRLMTSFLPKKAFPLAHAWRTANAALARAFRPLRDCDAALHREAADRDRNKVPATKCRQQSSRDNRRDFSLILLGRMAEIRSNNGLNTTTPITILCAARPFVIERKIRIRGRSVTRALHCRPNATRQGQK
jgi:hypothetical protein